MTLWLYLPDFWANTFAMMGKMVTKDRIRPWPIDGGKNGETAIGFSDANMEWANYGSLTSGLLCLVIVAMGDAPNSNNIDSQVFAHP